MKIEGNSFDVKVLEIKTSTVEMVPREDLSQKPRKVSNVCQLFVLILIELLYGNKKTDIGVVVVVSSLQRENGLRHGGDWPSGVTEQCGYC
ncbi:hypothetical protein ACS0TY_016347 [Phlomoides rotata]